VAQRDFGDLCQRCVLKLRERPLAAALVDQMTTVAVRSFRRVMRASSSDIGQMTMLVVHKPSPL
jgi:hypothetical protein